MTRVLLEIMLDRDVNTAEVSDYDMVANQIHNNFLPIAPGQRITIPGQEQGEVTFVVASTDAWTEEPQQQESRRTSKQSQHSTR